MIFYGVPVGEKFQRAMEKFQRGVEGGLVGPLCLRNPHDETVVARRTQWWTKPGHPPGGDASEFGRSFISCADQSPVLAERARSEANQVGEIAGGVTRSGHLTLVLYGRTPVFRT